MIPGPGLAQAWLRCCLLICLVSSPALAAGDIRIVSHNLNRLFNDQDDGNREYVSSTRKYRDRLDKLVEVIANEYQFADVLAFQEVENLAVLSDIADLLASRHNRHYRPYLKEGNDLSGIDVGYLVASKLKVKLLTPLFADWKLHGQAPLFSRPPLLLQACSVECLTLVNLHLRSMRGLGSAKKGKKVAQKRHRQAQTLAQWIQQRQTTNPAEQLILLGDFNALTPSDKHVDVIGTIRGDPDQKRPRLKSRDLVERDLIDISEKLPADQRVSYIYRKKPQQLDYMLVSQGLPGKVRSIRFGRIDYSLSDHASLSIELQLE